MGRMDHSTIKVNDDRLKFVTILSSSNTDFFYEFPTEPDLNYLKVWFMLDHLGARMRDMSGFGNHAYISGHPTLRRVGLNLGFQQTSDAGGTSATTTMLFNSGTDVVSQKNGEYIWIQDNPSIQFSQFSTGFSITFRFNCLDFNNHESVEFGSFVRRFAAKTDDASNGWSLVVYQIDQTGLNGVLEMNVVDDGITYKRRRVGFDINAWYQVVVTYDPNVTADARIKIYVAGTEGTTAGTTSLILSPHTNLRIGARDSETGFFYGYLHDFRLYMDKVLTQTEITNINTNEMTIDNISRGHVFVIQYAMVSQSLRSKTHRYNVGGFIIRERRHKFNIIKKLTVTKTHKFSMVIALSGTRTHKFDVVKLVARTRTHKYDMGGVLSITRTHKFNTLQKIERTRTHKYQVGLSEAFTQVVRFQKNSSGTNGVTQTITLNFAPKAIIIQSVGATGNNTYDTHYQWIQGFSDGTNHACVASVSDNADAGSETGRAHFNNSCYVRLLESMSGTVSVLERATCTFSGNDVIFTWAVNSTAATYINMWAIGGTSIAAKVNTVEQVRTTVGTQDHTGLGFTNVNGQGALFVIDAAALAANVNTATAGGWISLGCAVSTTASKQWSIANTNEDGVATTDTYRWTDSGSVRSLLSNTGTAHCVADLNAWISDGFRLNYSTLSGLGATSLFSYLAIHGGTWDAGTNMTRTTTGSQTNTVAVNSKIIKGLMTAVTGALEGTITAHARFGVGFATSSTSEAWCAALDADAVTTTSSVRRSNNIVCLGYLISTTAPAIEANFTSFGTDQFNISYTTVAASALPYGWVVVADE